MDGLAHRPSDYQVLVLLREACIDTRAQACAIADPDLGAALGPYGIVGDRLGIKASEVATVEERHCGDRTQDVDAINAALNRLKPGD